MNFTFPFLLFPHSKQAHVRMHIGVAPVHSPSLPHFRDITPLRTDPVKQVYVAMAPRVVDGRLTLPPVGMARGPQSTTELEYSLLNICSHKIHIHRTHISKTARPLTRFHSAGRPFGECLSASCPRCSCILL